jgi:hypothetical protein
MTRCGINWRKAKRAYLKRLKASLGMRARITVAMRKVEREMRDAGIQPLPRGHILRRRRHWMGVAA